MSRRRDEDPRNPLLLLLSFTVWNSVRPEYRNLELSVNGNLTSTENREKYRTRACLFYFLRGGIFYLDTVRYPICSIGR
jgi:hypothetical protein